jgi:CheY-like chemotaxis protein
LAKDGAEGLALAQSQNPELILLDYILPDMRGDEVCQRLFGEPQTSSIPVVLMSSSASEIKQVQERFSNVARSIAKPFTAELLCATVGYVLRELAQRGEANQQVAAAVAATKQTRAHGSIVFSGTTAYFSLGDALAGVQDGQLNGVFKIQIRDGTIEAYFDHGQPVVVTTKQVPLYMQESAFQWNDAQRQVEQIVTRGQTDCSCPLFILLVGRGVLGNEEMLNLCMEHGYKLFSRAWTHRGARFEFEDLAQLPEFCRYLPVHKGSMDQWCFETLRRIGDESLTALAWGEPSGIPAFTRRGYDRIQQIPLSKEEMAFVGYATAGYNLEQIAQQMGIAVEHAQRILFRFLAMEIFDYWPAAALGR